MAFVLARRYLCSSVSRAVRLRTPRLLPSTRLFGSASHHHEEHDDHGDHHADHHWHYPDRHTVESRILEIIKSHPKVGAEKELKLDSTWSSLGLDSLDSVEAILAIEHEFCLNISDDVADKFSTLKEVADYVTAHPMAIAQGDHGHHH
eukprot:TRINITY_DN627_c0_g1_i1.p1 TRINITY_DN627_c0_g1~~TRINITY_DN627_c0_g1_i1.p1  ORF type:complete len:165 (+),score=44.29 TRINITY_DN627_c0_g1_i1:54-497(+)